MYVCIHVRVVVVVLWYIQKMSQSAPEGDHRGDDDLEGALYIMFMCLHVDLRMKARPAIDPRISIHTTPTKARTQRRLSVAAESREVQYAPNRAVSIPHPATYAAACVLCMGGGEGDVLHTNTANGPVTYTQNTHSVHTNNLIEMHPPPSPRRPRPSRRRWLRRSPSPLPPPGSCLRVNRSGSCLHK